jgi:hypothetical protein
VAVGLGADVGVFVGMGVAVGMGIAVEVSVAVAPAVGVSVSVLVGRGAEVDVAVGVRVGPGVSLQRAARRAMRLARPATNCRRPMGLLSAPTLSIGCSPVFATKVSSAVSRQ